MAVGVVAAAGAVAAAVKRSQEFHSSQVFLLSEKLDKVWDFNRNLTKMVVQEVLDPLPRHFHAMQYEQSLALALFDSIVGLGNDQWQSVAAKTDFPADLPGGGIKSKFANLPVAFDLRAQ